MNLRSFRSLFAVAGSLLIIVTASCKKDPVTTSPTQPTINVPNAGAVLDFGNVVIGQFLTKNLVINGSNLTGDIVIGSTDGYTVSLNNSLFYPSVTIPAADVSTGKTLYIKFSPTAYGVKSGTISFQSAGASNIDLQVTGNGGIQRTYTTFLNENLAFGAGLSQSAEHQYTMASDLTHVNQVKMYVKLRCPSGNCGDWDVFAHIQVKEPTSGDWYEIGRYITPYGVDNSATGRGFEIDVTDFKSMLQGTVTLRAFIEVWTADGWLLSVDFDYLEGTPDFPYYAVSKVLQYNQNSLEGVIYGEDASTFDLTKTIAIPANAEATVLRTIISGWGHATPNDPDGRPCAEWCYRTHHVKINGTNTFDHYMGPIGCGSNPVQPQGGNWQPDRAGWCPGMAVPVRRDQLATSMAGQSLGFEYSFAPWVNNLQSTSANIHAYNAISTYVIVKSSMPITAPVVTN